MKAAKYGWKKKRRGIIPRLLNKRGGIQVKRSFYFALLLAVVLVTVSCQKAEEITISKYFKAMGFKDTTTLAAMAIEPVQMQFKSWKIASIEPPEEMNYPLPEMVNKLEELKKSMNEQLDMVKDKKTTVDILDLDVADARGKKKAELQTQLDEAKRSFEAEKVKYDQIRKEHDAFKAQLENEKRLILISTDMNQDLEALEGKCFKNKVNVSVMTDNGEKTYIFHLKRYELLNTVTKKPMHNKFAIEKITVKE